MEKKVCFETLAELQETYPVGSVIMENTEEWTSTNCFYSQRDLDLLKASCSVVIPVDDTTCFCKHKRITKKVVEGYLYDGELWYPAYATWDGWLPYDEYDLMTREELRKKRLRELEENARILRDERKV